MPKPHNSHLNKKRCVAKGQVRHRQIVLHGDCLTIMNRLEPVDLVVTSPPYNLGIPYGKYQDDLPYDRYLKWMNDVLASIKGVLKDDGSLFLNVGSSCRQPWIDSDVANVARKHFQLQNRIIWIKSITVNERTHGHFKPINSERFLNHNFESIYHFTKTGNVKLDRLAIGVRYVDKNNIRRRKNDGGDLRCGGNIWLIPYKTVRNKKTHPAAFPVELAERCIKLHGIEKGMVTLDPFLGSGSTLVACKRLGVDGIGIDMDEGYVRLSKERLREDARAIPGCSYAIAT